MVTLAGLPVIPLRSLPSVPAGAKRTSMPISLMSAVRAGQSGIAIFSILLRYGNRGSRFAPAPSTVAAIRRRSPTTPSSGMRLGLCAQLKRLWIRLVMKTVLPERLKPVTASQTVAPPASSPRLSRSDAWAKIGDSQLKFTKEDILNPRAPQHSRAGPAHREVGLKSGFRKWSREVDGAARPIVRSPHARPSRSRTRILRPFRVLADAGRARLDRLQRPSQHGLLQHAVRSRGGRGLRTHRLRPRLRQDAQAILLHRRGARALSARAP